MFTQRIKSSKSLTHCWQPHCVNVPQTTGTLFSEVLLLYLFLWCSFCIYLLKCADRGSWVGPWRSMVVGKGWHQAQSPGSWWARALKRRQHARLLVDSLDEDSWYLSAVFQPAMHLFWHRRVNSAMPLGHDPPWLRLLPANTFQRWIRGTQRTDANPEIDDVNMGASFEHDSLRGCGGADSEKMMDLCRTATALDRKFSLADGYYFRCLVNDPWLFPPSKQSNV